MIKIILWVVLGIALGGLFSGAYYFLKSPEQGGLIETAKPLKDTSVILEKVYLIRPGYVAVYENNNGELGEIIGASEFITGVEENLMIFTKKNVESVIVKIYYGRGDFPSDIENFEVDKSEEATIVISK